MTFQEFFNKKRIDLVALKAGEPGLYAEFEKHFNQMGEKSFDHTKKYWFNKLRLQYHLAPELKPEKVHLENRLAEQTIVETLTDTIPVPTTGFKPRFKPGMASKPAEDQNKTPVAETFAETKPETSAPASKPGFKPRFNAKMAVPKSADEPETPKPENEAAPETSEPVAPTEATAPKPGFKPRFNMKMTQGAAPQKKELDEEPKTGAASDQAEPPKESETPKPAGFKPRFNMKTMAPKPAATTAEPAETEPVAAEDKPSNASEPTPLAEPTIPKIGFKPRFNAKTTKPKPPEE